MGKRNEASMQGPSGPNHRWSPQFCKKEKPRGAQRKRREGIRQWMHFYNHRRRHQDLEKRTPDTLYYHDLNAEARASAQPIDDPLNNPGLLSKQWGPPLSEPRVRRNTCECRFND